jgi:hypothetical protein
VQFSGAVVLSGESTWRPGFRLALYLGGRACENLIKPVAQQKLSSDFGDTARFVDH